jgi:hypothetical protein
MIMKFKPCPCIILISSFFCGTNEETFHCKEKGKINSPEDSKVNSLNMNIEGEGGHLTR